jgi:5-methylcytosine-specific restriction protein A
MHRPEGALAKVGMLSLVEFENREPEYHRWLADNPHGFVVTTYKVFRPNYIRLHAARCHLIRKYMRHMASDAFTGQQFKKVCSESAGELRSWAKANGYSEVHVCGTCKPLAPEVR